jgi:murein DD-endopeptidase MepM/ murein hydrolase activator NlpD
LFRWRFSISFLTLLLLAWSGLTLGAGFILGRHADYWVTKADNEILRTRVAYMTDEIVKSREFLEIARTTDRQIRQLLGMRAKPAAPEGAGGMGGPNPADRAGLIRRLSEGSAQAGQRAFHQSVREIRCESERRLASYQEIAWYIANQRSLLVATPCIWPAAGRVTSPYGYRFSPMRRFSSDDGEGQFHSGIDIANSRGTPIAATAEGVVRFAGWSGGYGLMVLIDHGLGYTTLYGHTSKILVRPGEHVARRQPIAAMGSSGRATGTHLHYEVWHLGRPANPMKYLQAQPNPFSGLLALK